MKKTYTERELAFINWYSAVLDDIMFVVATWLRILTFGKLNLDD